MRHLRFKDYLLVTGGVLVIVSSLFFAYVNPAGSAGSAPVTVANTPLPVEGTVNVGNFPASNPVTGSVNITGTPNVNVVNTDSNPVPTQNVGGGAATHMGQPASELVDLFCTPPSCTQVFPDGHVTFGFPPFSIPTGKALVVTDIQFNLRQSSAGQGNYDSLSLCVNGNCTVPFGVGFPLATFSALVDANGHARGERHLANGIVMAGSPTIHASGTTDGSATIQGYLAPNQ